MNSPANRKHSHGAVGGVFCRCTPSDAGVWIRRSTSLRRHW